ncbi:MAG: Asp23/Gls24 family envelope stress response protein [Candidatus Omnitrophica bacterium]|nr:Asp23/Gls24 family envelope stress response protein [Candidatus Omnitrophota bacterium]
MREKDNVDLGFIKIHKKVIAEIVNAVIDEFEGVGPVEKDFAGNLKDILGDKNFPGTRIIVDRNNKVAIDVKIKVQYGLNIPEVARSTQEAIRKAVEKTVDVDLKNVNVNVQGIERGE